MEKPRVGMGATIVFPSDNWPYVITRVSPNGSKIVLRPLDTRGMNGKTYTAEDLINKVAPFGEWRTANRHSDGWYYIGGCIPVSVGYARLYLAREL